MNIILLCTSLLHYGLECFSFSKADIKSFDFTITRFLMKLFRSANVDVMNEWKLNFNFRLSSDIMEYRKAELDSIFVNFSSLLHCYGISASFGVSNN